MARDRNPFEVLHRLRSVNERRRRAELATAHLDEERARRLMEDVRASLEEPHEIGDRISRLQLRALQIRGITSNEMLDMAAREYESARKNTRVAAGAWRKSVGDADAAEKLATQRREKIAREASASAERMLDDLMTIRRAIT